MREGLPARRHRLSETGRSLPAFVGRELEASSLAATARAPAGDDQRAFLQKNQSVHS